MDQNHEAFVPRPPTHNLCIAPKGEDGTFVTVGAGWENDKGQINIKLNQGTTLNWRDCDDCSIYLFRRTDK